MLELVADCSALSSYDNIYWICWIREQTLVAFIEPLGVEIGKLPEPTVLRFKVHLIFKFKNIHHTLRVCS